MPSPFRDPPPSERPLPKISKYSWKRCLLVFAPEGVMVGGATMAGRVTRMESNQPCGGCGQACSAEWWPQRSPQNWASVAWECVCVQPEPPGQGGGLILAKKPSHTPCQYLCCWVMGQASWPSVTHSKDIAHLPEALCPHTCGWLCAEGSTSHPVVMPAQSHRRVLLSLL